MAIAHQRRPARTPLTLRGSCKGLAKIARGSCGPDSRLTKKAIPKMDLRPTTTGSFLSHEERLPNSQGGFLG